MTQLPTTEQGTVTASYWTLAIGGSWNINVDPAEAQMVFVKIDTMSDEEIATAMRDPANVLNVAAMPEVVKALAEGVQYEELRCGKRGQVAPLPRWVHNARNHLALVHPAPAEGDKG